MYLLSGEELRERERSIAEAEPRGAAAGPSCYSDSLSPLNAPSDIRRHDDAAVARGWRFVRVHISTLNAV